MRIGLTRIEFDDLNLSELASLLSYLGDDDKHQVGRDANILCALYQPHAKTKLKPSDFMPKKKATAEEQSKKVENQMLALKAMAKGFKPAEKTE